MEVPGPRVISEPFPGLQNPFKRRLCKIVDRWEGLQELFVIRDDGCHLGLLEHDLRDPDCIGIPGFSPGKVSAVLMKPLEEAGLNLGP